MGKPVFTVNPPTIAAVPTIGSKISPDFDINIPGGMLVSMPCSSGPTSDCRLVLDKMMPSLSLSMAPFGIVFCIMDVLQKVKAAIEAVPDAISTLNVTALVSAISDMASAFSCLLNAIPSLSVPAFVKDVLDILIVAIDCTAELLQGIVSAITELNAQIEENVSLSNPTLDAAIESAKQNYGKAVDQYVELLNPFQPIFTVVNILLSLIGAGSISWSVPGPLTDSTDIAEINALVADLQSLSAQLAAIRGAIP